MTKNDIATQPDLHQYWRILKKRVWIIVGVTLAVGATAAVITMRRPRIFQATTTIIIDPSAPKVLGPDSLEVVQLGSGNAWADTEYYNTQYRILTSDSLARETVTRFSLQNEPRLAGDRPGRGESDLIDDATEALRKRLVVAPVRDSHVFTISVRDTSPELSARLANDVAQVYIDQNLSVKRETTSKAKGWVSKLLDSSRRDLDVAETALYSYKKDKNILSVSLEDQKNKIAKALDAFSGALTDAKKKRIDLETRRRAVAALVKDDVTKAPSSFLVDAPTIDRLREVYLDELRKLSGLEERYGPKHQDVVTQKARVDAAKAGVQEAAESMLKAIDGEIGALRDAESRYFNEVASLTKDAFELNKQEIEYKRLSRDATNAEQVYTQLLKRLNESGLQEQDHANNIRLLDPARVPDTQVEPNLKIAIVVGLALGLTLALSLAFFLEFVDRTVKNQEDVENLLGVPFLGIVPSVETLPAASRGTRPELHVYEHPKSSLAECCRVVRTNVLFCSPDRPLRSLVITSANASEGKTMNVLQLGIVMAQSGQRTLLVDTDMRRPQLHKKLRIPNDVGVSSLVVGEAEIDAAVKSTEVPNLFVLPCGPLPPNPAELLQTERFGALVRTLAGKFDRVIFDSPPLLAVTDAAVLSSTVDGTILIARAGRTNRETLARGHQSLASVNANLVGVILNDVNLKNPHYSHYYYYYKQKYDAPAPAVSGESAGG